MTTANKVLIHRWFEEVWNKGRSAAIDEMLDRQGLVYGLTNNEAKPIVGPAEFKPFHEKFKNAFPGLKVAVESTLAEQDLVCARCLVRGTHSGETLGFPATGRSVLMNGICVARIRDGKIVEAWNNFDFLSLYQQLGAVKQL